MKKALIVLVLIVLTIHTKAQCWEPNTLNTTTTDWRISGSSNTWDWTQVDFTDMYIKGKSKPWTVKSPFWTPQSSTGTNSLLTDFRKYVARDKKDFHPEDGWELLVRNFGEASAGAGEENATGYPFFALYNRYTSKVRAFLLVPSISGGTKSGAILKTHFIGNSRKTAIFQHLKPIAQPVSNFEHIDTDMPNEYSNTADYWLFSEFTVAYDPCTCHNLGDSKQSMLKFDYFVVDESTINATISGTLSEKVTETKQPVGGDPSHALTGMDAAKKLIAAGQKGYKEYGKYKDSYNKYLLKFTDSLYRDKLWNSIDNNKVIDTTFYNEVVKGLFINMGYTDLSYESYMQGDLDLNPTFFTDFDFDAENTFLNKNYTAIKGVANALPYIGTAIAVVDFFVSSGGEKSSVAAKGPTVFEANLVMDGTIKKVDGLGPHEIYTPGYTNDHATYNFIPSYNNILGVINVLELPDFEFFEIKPNITNITKNSLNPDLRNLCEENFSDFNNIDGAQEITFKQFKPKSTLKYVVNPASNMEVISIEAAIILEYSGADPLFMSRPSQFNSRKAIPYFPEMTKADIEDTTYYLGWSFDSSIRVFPKMQISNSSLLSPGVYINNGGKLTTLSGGFAANLIKIKEEGSATVKRVKNIESNTNLQLDILSGGYPRLDSSTIQFRTDYLPITCFEDLNFTVLGNNNYGKIYTKLMIRLKHKTNNSIKPVTMILSFDLKDKINAATKGSIEGTYNANIWGRNWSEKNRCCRKCAGAIRFESANISEYFYSNNFNITSIPHGDNFFKNHSGTYAGEQHLTSIGDLLITDNSVVPVNSIIRAGGKITFGSNVTIGSGSEFYSATEIDLSKVTNISPNVSFEIIDLIDLKYNCTNYNYSNNMMTNTEITTFCNSQEYKDRAVLYKWSSEEIEEQSFDVVEKLSFRIIPNPNKGVFKVNFNKEIENFTIEILDINGQLTFMAKQSEKVIAYSIDEKALKPGIYFIRITDSSNSMQVKKLVKY